MSGCADGEFLFFQIKEKVKCFSFSIRNSLQKGWAVLCFFLFFFEKKISEIFNSSLEVKR